jgi:hypothetical protein
MAIGPITCRRKKLDRVNTGPPPKVRSRVWPLRKWGHCARILACGNVNPRLLACLLVLRGTNARSTTLPPPLDSQCEGGSAYRIESTTPFPCRWRDREDDAKPRNQKRSARSSLAGSSASHPQCRASLAVLAFSCHFFSRVCFTSALPFLLLFFIFCVSFVWPRLLLMAAQA